MKAHRILRTLGVVFVAIMAVMAAALIRDARTARAQVSRDVTICAGVDTYPPCDLINRDTPDLSVTRVGNNALSSVNLWTGNVIAIYSETNYTGECWTIDRSVDDLRDPNAARDNHTPANDRAKSIRVGRSCAQNVPAVILYDLPTFGGADLRSETSIDNLYRDGGFDKRASSLKVTGGSIAAVYTNYGANTGGGSCLTVRGDVATLPAGFDNGISSFRLNYACEIGPASPQPGTPYVHLRDQATGLVV
jgi:hypothetical protein